MPAALAPDPAADTYEDVELLIYKVVNKFHRRFGGDPEEYIAEANLTFQRVYRAYNPALGSFGNVLWTSVWRRLSNINRRNINARQNCRVSLDAAKNEANDRGETLAANYPDPRPPAARAMEMLEALSPDARAVAALVFDPPDKVARTAEEKGGQAANWRSTLRAYLAELGWAAARITESFDEIRRASP